MGMQILMAASMAGMLLSPPQNAGNGAIFIASDCSDAARRVAAESGGQVLSMQSDGDSCVITVLVPGNGGRPKKVTVRVPM